MNIVSCLTTNDISWRSCGDCFLENDILEELQNLKGWNCMLHPHISLYSSSWQYPIYCHKQWTYCLYHVNKSVWQSKLTMCEERENQQDAAIRRLLSTSVSTCFGHHYAHLQENEDRVTAFGVLLWFSWMWLVAVVGCCVAGCEQCSHPATQRPTTATNHIQQNQSSTPYAVTRSLFSWRWA